MFECALVEAYLIVCEFLAAFSKQRSFEITMCQQSISLKYCPPKKLFPTCICSETNIMLFVVLFRTLLMRAAKPSFQLILLTTFLYFFGLPAIETYGKKEVMVVEKKRDTDGIPFPAITIAALGQKGPEIC